MPYKEIKRRILAVDEESLSQTLVEQLIKSLPEAGNPPLPDTIIYKYYILLSCYYSIHRLIHYCMCMPLEASTNMLLYIYPNIMPLYLSGEILPHFKHKLSHILWLLPV